MMEFENERFMMEEMMKTEQEEHDRTETEHKIIKPKSIEGI